MNLEQLQAMSDAELNELSAVKVMGKLYQHGKMWEIVEGTEKHRWLCDWNPTTDMNDAMELWDKLHSQGWELSLLCDHKITTPWDCRMFLMEDHDVIKKVITHDKTASRAITITSILAKESE